MSSQYPKVCFDRYLPPNPYSPTPELTDAQKMASQSLAVRAAIIISKRWANNSTLRVRFMGGTASQQKIVKDFAPKWCDHANLRFDFNNAPNAEIRISFDQNDGAWSYLGKDCLGIPLNQATMNLGWQDEGVVLHEFGHAIGLIHEHQNPLDGGIQWNRDNVIRDLSGSPNFWDLDTIEHNMFKKYDQPLVNGTALDKFSIMLYAIPKTWTLDGFQSEPNEVLSAKDKEFIGSSQGYQKSTAPEAEPTELSVVELTPTAAAIGAPGEEDLFKFNAAKAGRYTVETMGPTDVTMSLFGPNSQTTQIGQDDDSGEGSNAKITAELVPGTYFVQIRHYNRTGGIGTYSVRVSRSAAPAALTQKASM